MKEANNLLRVNLFASDLQVVCKYFTNPMEVVCIASKPIQTIIKLVCYEVIKYKCFANALVSKPLLSHALQVPWQGIA